MTRTGDREIRSVSGRLPDNPGELACMNFTEIIIFMIIIIIIFVSGGDCRTQSLHSIVYHAPSN